MHIRAHFNHVGRFLAKWLLQQVPPSSMVNRSIHFEILLLAPWSLIYLYEKGTKRVYTHGCQNCMKGQDHQSPVKGRGVCAAVIDQAGRRPRKAALKEV